MQPDFTINILQTSLTEGTFAIEPLPQGYGHTLGNALRRVLYTSIPGAAITSVKIAGANHQFTSIEGVREDMVQLILALKQVRLSYSGSTPVEISLSVSGAKQITAADFETPANVTIANPELVIAHLSDKSSKLELTATVESGLGYSPAEERKSDTVGLIPVDAIYSPVSRVNYEVSATRVGRVTNFDKLIISITTDGTIAPQAALTAAASNLVSFLQGIISPQSAGVTPNAFSIGTKTGSTITIEELDLPTRITNALQKSGLDTVSAVLSTPRAELAKVKNLGAKSVKIIEAALAQRGIELN